MLSTRCLSWMLAGVIILGATGGRSQAQDLVFEKNGWRGSLLTTADRFDACIAMAKLKTKSFLGIEQESEMIMGLALGRDGVWKIAFTKSTGGFRPNKRYDMTLIVDGKEIHRGTTIVEKSGTAYLQPSVSFDAIKALGNGDSLQIVTDVGKQTYSLAGSEDAIALTSKCVAENTASSETGALSEEAKPQIDRSGVVTTQGYMANPATPDWDDCRRNDDNSVSILGCTKVIESGRESSITLSEAFNNRGLARYLSGWLDGRVEEFDRAISDLDAAVKLNPSSADAHLNRGMVYDSKGQYDKAVVDFNSAIRLSPTLAPAFSARGAAYHALGNFAVAIADYTEALRLAPNGRLNYSRRGNAYLSNGEHDRAIADFSQAIRLETDLFSVSLSFLSRGNTYLAKGQPDRALLDYDEAIKRYPRFSQAFGKRGVAYLAMGQFDRALTDLDQAIKLEPASPFAFAARAAAYEGIKDTDRAMRDYQTALALPARDQDGQRAKEAAAKRLAELNERQSISTGTGFFVSSEGNVLTNAHVVKGCTTAQVAQPGGKSEPARIVAVDATNDLALLSVSWRPSRVPNLRAGAKTGEGVASYGFPHVGMLPSTGNFTLGNVSATSGLGDDSRMLQISAPVQSGNSGGPLMDQSGNVVGVVVAKLNVLKVLKERGDLPQNVNFAIKASVARTFLEANGIAEATAKPAVSTLSPPDLADVAKQFTVFIACRG